MQSVSPETLLRLVCAVREAEGSVAWSDEHQVVRWSARVPMDLILKDTDRE
jgi:hypothetical protein